MVEYKHLQNLIKRRPKSNQLKKMRDAIFSSDGDEEVLINNILSTEFRPYIDELVDFFLEKERDFETTIDMVDVDDRVSRLQFFVRDKVLQNIVMSHHSAVHRIAAFTCDYLIRANEELNA